LSVVRYPAGTDIVREGELSDSFYFINEGEVEVKKTTSFRGERGKKAVFSVLGRGETFGEMALLMSSSRSATVTAKTDVALYQLKKMDFEQIVLEDSTLAWKLQEQVEGYDRFNQMKALEPFVHLQPDQMAMLFEKLAERKYGPGEDIIRQGEEGDFYYIIKSGHVIVLKQTDEKEPRKMAVLSECEGFGEEALLTGAPRSATVRALEETILWALSKSDFEDVLKSAYLEEAHPEDVPVEGGGPYTLLDVRMRAEFEDEHIPGAVNIPLGELRKAYSRLDPSREYFVYSLDGTRSAIAAFLLKTRGFRAKNIRGGLNAWSGRLTGNMGGVHTPSRPTGRESP
jgi:CRP-like cAMP-binding protein